MFQKRIVEKIKTHICAKTFFSSENRAIYEVMWNVWYIQPGHKWQYGACALRAGYQIPQGEHKVFLWLQTFITGKLRGIQTYFFLPLLKLVSKILRNVFIVILQLHNLLVSKWRQWRRKPSVFCGITKQNHRSQCSGNSEMSTDNLRHMLKASKRGIQSL